MSDGARPLCFDGQSHFELSPASRARLTRVERHRAKLRAALVHVDARSTRPGLSLGRRRWLRRQGRTLARELRRFIDDAP